MTANTEAIALLDGAIKTAVNAVKWNLEQAANAQGIADKYRAAANGFQAKADNLRDARDML